MNACDGLFAALCGEHLACVCQEGFVEEEGRCVCPAGETLSGDGCIPGESIRPHLTMAMMKLVSSNYGKADL